MSGIDLLLRTAIDYERTHQIVLFTLLSESKLSEVLLNVASPKHIHLEPERGLFDLAVQNDSTTTYVEIKMWSSLSLEDKQFQRQVDFLRKNKSRGVYILLGTSWFEHTEKSISDKSDGLATKIGYDELLSSLNKLIVATGQTPEVYELALAYRNAVQKQYDDRIRTAYKNKEDQKLFFYGIYREIQSRLKGIETSIYTVYNPGGPEYILNNNNWLSFTYENAEVELYYELVDGKLYIKFYTEAPNETKRKLRDNLREAIRRVYGSDYKIVDSGRLGKYMTACQIEHDFTDIEKFEDSARIFTDIGLKLEKVKEVLKDIS